MKAIIVQGCKTDHGGVVLQGHPTISVNGIGMAAKGYMVACPKCKGIFPISESAENFTLPDGNPVALATMKTACGASLLPSSFLVVVEPSSPFGSQLVGNPNDEGEETVPPPDDFTGRFRLINQSTGQPISNRRVRVVRADGTSQMYASDDEGYTDWIQTEEEQDIHLELIHELDNG